MFKNKLLLLIFIVALLLRIVKLGAFPVGFHADEIRVAWNSLSILKTGHDDKGNFLPLYYNTFGDYRPTGIFYMTVPSLAVFGTNEFAVRFPAALDGALMVFPLYLLVVQLTKNKRLALMASALLAISPWQIEVSRATSEAVMAAFLTLFALYFFIKAIREKEVKAKNYIVSLLFVLASYFFYHSTRLITPLFFLITAAYFWTETADKKIRKMIIMAVAGTAILTVVFAINPDSRGRLTQVSIFGDVDTRYEISKAQDLINNKYTVYAKRFFNEYAKYFSPDFLVGYKAKPYRYITPGVGILTFAEGALLIVGLTRIARKKESALPLLLLLASPLAAALTTEDSPNLMRSFYMVPFVAILGAYGLETIFEINKYKNLVRYSILGVILLNFIFFLNMYFRHSYIHRPLLSVVDMDNSSYRNAGTKEMAVRLDTLKSKYEKIIVTGDPDNMYPWYAFFTGKDPEDFNKNTKQYENIYFSDLRCPSDDSFVQENPDNLLAIDMWECAPESKIHDGLEIKIIEKTKRSDNSDVFKLITRSDQYFINKKNK